MGAASASFAALGMSCGECPPTGCPSTLSAQVGRGRALRRLGNDNEVPTRQRKLPLVIHIEPLQLVALNKTCRYCPHCDLLIAHQDQLEAWLAAFFTEHRPEIVGNDYLVLGTEDRADWLRGVDTPVSPAKAFEQLHDFREVVRFTPPSRWVKE
jgi:hypothetical protein